MAVLTHTFTRTYNTINFADPYKKCEKCGRWVDGVLDKPGPMIVVPCEHEAHYQDVCPSWGPVDGCTCPDEWHEKRTPDPTDGKVY